MRKLLSLLFILFALKAVSQPLNNEWIDYSKPYYKFKLGSSSLCRITQASLATVGLQNTPVEQFQLWRNGKQVPLYTTIPTGMMGANDFIEFWGKKNDGKPDKYLYKDSSFQLSDRLSLLTDTAAFFLTVNPNPTTFSPNLRFTDASNIIPSSPPTPLPYFTYSQYFDFDQGVNTYINWGFYETVDNDALYSSSYDLGEFPSSSPIQQQDSLSAPVSPLYAANTVSAATLQAAVVGDQDQLPAGGGSTIRTVKIKFNTDNVNVLLDTLTTLYPRVVSTTIPISTLTGAPTSLQVSIAATNNSSDYVVCSYIKLTYQRLFNFGGQTSFFFNLPSSADSNYLQITNFSSGSVAPVLYDFTNQFRYVANTSIAGTLQFELPPSAINREFVLVNEDPSLNSINTITSFQQRNFVNYSINQANYLIISDSSLGLTGNGAVSLYQQYRVSTGFNAKIYAIDQLVDQFGFGIKKNPLSVKNFIRYANRTFSKKPSYVLLLGRGMRYDDYRGNQNSPYADQLNVVPTWGWPASDALLVSPGLDPNPTIGFGRVSAVSQAEVNTYLAKVKAYEGHSTDPQTIEARSWMKNIIHVVGGDNDGENNSFTSYVNGYKSIISGPPFGGNVTTFNKTTSTQATGATNTQLINQINSGISLLTYFGHGSNTVLDYSNLDDPTVFGNYGKYPMFLMNGCSVGDVYQYDTSRLSNLNYFSEKYLFTPSLGSIGIVCGSHFGITDKLNTYTTGFYTSLASSGYNTGVATNMQAGTAALASAYGGNFNDYFTRTHAEEFVLEGDPAVKIYASALPDYAVEQQDIVVSPSILSVSNISFTVKAYLYNIGKVTTDSVNVLIQRVYPNGTIEVLYNQKRPYFAYEDSVIMTIPIVGSRDKGTNQIIVNIDNTQQIPEITYSNNVSTATFSIFDNGITPVYPYNYAIVDKAPAQLLASTANPLTPMNTLTRYTMDIDTTALFNSPLKSTSTASSSIGGVISFTPNIIFTDSTVYYWRVAQVPTSGPTVYNSSSFIYLTGSGKGFNQSHLYQHLQSSMSRINLDSASRQWRYLPDSNNNMTMNLGIYPTTAVEDIQFSTSINNNPIAQSACEGHSIVFNVYDANTLLPYYNQPIPSIVPSSNPTPGGFMGSAANCPNKEKRQFNFEYQLYDAPSRELLKEFMDWIPSGTIVTARMNWDVSTPYIPFANVWAGDSTKYGDTTLYNDFKSIGFYAIDSFNSPRTFGLIYKKNNPAFGVHWKFSNGVNDFESLSLNIVGTDSLGFVTSPQFGPAYSWKQLQWRGSSLEAKPADAVTIYVIGIDTSGNKTALLSFDNTVQNQDISSINAAQYPYIQLMMRNADSTNLIPWQLRYWRVLANLVPEGAMAPNVKWTFTDTANNKPNPTDSFQTGETITEAIAFKNISDTTFRDSIAVQMQIVDNNNNINIIPVPKLKRLAPGDTAIIRTNINASNFVGNNTLYINVNPNNNQPEQYHYNNFIYQNFYVAGSSTSPVLDVTFDGVHILNKDIVSSKPDIKIKLVDNAKYLLLNDTSTISVQLGYYPPNAAPEVITPVYYSSGTLRFTPATSTTSENAATVDYSPSLSTDGQYELIVTGKNKAGLQAGTQQYKVSFQVRNTPEISNVFNYPNPFSTSTAFVFTLTGSEVPQNMKIEIMTISGKIVKEITREQLGPLHIGNNITAYKWDGRDMFGAKLGNGVYLYRVVTKLNGNTIGKYSNDLLQNNDVNTDSYFKGGYGKMYLMR